MSLKGLKTQLGEVKDAYLDPLFDKPDSAEEILQKIKNKELGIEWWEEETRKLNALKNLLPEKRQQQVGSILTQAGEMFDEAWKGAETVENWWDIPDVLAAGGAHGVNIFNQGVGLLSQGVAAGLHHGARIHKPAADLTGNVASVYLTRKVMNTGIGLTNKAIASKTAHNIAFSAGKTAGNLTQRFRPVNQRTVNVRSMRGNQIPSEGRTSAFLRRGGITDPKGSSAIAAYEQQQINLALSGQPSNVFLSVNTGENVSKTLGLWDGINRVGPDSKYVLPGETYYTPFGPWPLKSNTNIDAIPKIDTSLNKLVLNKKTSRSTLYKALDTPISRNIDPKHLKFSIDDIIEQGFATQLGLRQGAGQSIAGKLPGYVKRRDKLAAIPEETRSAGLSRDPLKGAQKNVKTNFRNLRDLFSLNLLTKHKDIFKIDRKGIKDALVNFKVGDKEWHHTFFGNKEGGKLFLNKVSQDPVLAINLMAKLQELNLPTSGVVENLALIEKLEGPAGIGHNKLHNIYRELGLEQGGDLDFSEIVDAVSKAYLAGDETAVNHFFTLLEVYAERTAPYMAEQTRKAGGVMFKDTSVETLPSVQKYKPKSTKFRN